MSAKIRLATEDDYSVMLDLWNRAGLPHEPERRDSLDSFRRQLNMYGDCTLVAELQGKVVGTLLGTHDHRKGWINRLAVDPAYQNQGVAQRMIAAAEAAFRSKKIDIYCALVETDNRPSRATFLKAGYVERSDVVYFRKELKL